MSMLSADLKAIEIGLSKIDMILKSPSELPGDQFKAKMAQFHAASTTRYDAVKNKLQIAQERLAKVLRYYAEDASQDADEFFGLIDRFIDNFNVRLVNSPFSHSFLTFLLLRHFYSVLSIVGLTYSTVSFLPLPFPPSPHLLPLSAI